MSVEKYRGSRPFTRIPNHTLQNLDLSLEALGLLSRLLSYPPDWEFNLKSLSAQYKEGKQKLRSAITELMEAGYVTRYQSQGKWIYRISPELQNEPSVCQPSVCQPSEKQTAGKQTTYKETISTNKTNIDKETLYVEPHDEFLDFVNLWNSERSPIWANCKVLSQARVSLLRRLIKDAGSRAAALEILEKACKYGREDKFWGEKRMTLENVLRHAVELSERCLETPNGHVITQAEFQMAAQQQKADELAQRLRKKFGFPQENN
jgi:hypothetical protein